MLGTDFDPWNFIKLTGPCCWRYSSLLPFVNFPSHGTANSLSGHNASPFRKFNKSKEIHLGHWKASFPVPPVLALISTGLDSLPSTFAQVIEENLHINAQWRKSTSLFWSKRCHYLLYLGLHDQKQFYNFIHVSSCGKAAHAPTVANMSNSRNCWFAWP